MANFFVASLFPCSHKSCDCLLQGDLGYLYLDLYSRKGKYPGCASFAIRGGRKISETEYQLPVCWFKFHLFSFIYENCLVGLKKYHFLTLRLLI